MLHRAYYKNYFQARSNVFIFNGNLFKD